MCPGAVPWQPQLPTAGRSSLLSAVNSIVTGRAPSPHPATSLARTLAGQATIQHCRRAWAIDHRRLEPGKTERSAWHVGGRVVSGGERGKQEL